MPVKPPAVTTIEIAKEYLHFGAAHFTIFSADERENLHGHNFHVQAEVTATIGDDGLTFDYNVIKDALRSFCDSLDEKTLLPERSPYLALDEDDRYVSATFAGETLLFLPRDVLILPLRNITVEELAGYALTELLRVIDTAELGIMHIIIRVSSGADQWARCEWSA